MAGGYSDSQLVAKANAIGSQTEENSIDPQMIADMFKDLIMSKYNKDMPLIKGDTGDAGPSAYQVWLALGNSGTAQEYVESLKGEDGDPGPSAYEAWLSLGNVGTEQEFIDSLRGDDGDPGPSAYQVWLALGNVGSPQDFADNLKGEEGDLGPSAYEAWLALGNTGTEQEFIDSLKGDEGTSGEFREFENKLQWRLRPEDAWIDLIFLNNPLNPDRFSIDVVTGELDIMIDEEPTAASEKMIPSRVLHGLFSNALGLTPGFVPAVHPFGLTSVRRVMIRNNRAIITRSSGGTRIASSHDGLFFTAAEPGATTGSALLGLIEADGVWIVTGDTASQRSTDGGYTWENMTIPDSRILTQVAYGSKVLVAAANNGIGQRALRSVDLGVTWTLATSVENDNSYSGCAYAYGNFYLLASSGTGRVQRSTDLGVTFAAVTVPTGNWNRATPYRGKVVFSSGGGAGNKIAVSSDHTGTSFTSVSNGFNSENITSIKQIGRWLYTTSSSGRILRTDDLVNWEVIAELGVALDDIDGGYINNVPVIMVVASTGDNRVFTSVQLLLGT